jgi:autotransporter-associated beta strand protein
MGVCQSMLLGGVSFSSGTAKWTFDADTSGGTQQKSITLAPPSSSAMPVPSNYQLKSKYLQGNATASAFGSIGYVVNPTTATFTLSPGTGVQQSDPNNDYPGDSLVRVDFDGFFSPTSPSFGPPATGYVSVAVGGIVGSGGHSQFTGVVDFLNGSNNAQLRPTVKFDKLFSSAGSFAQTFTSSSLLSPSTIPVGTKVRVKGYFEFRASNAFSPSSILPLDIEFGGAPPTATWYSNDSTSWSNPANWTAPAGSIIDDPDNTMPGVPDGAGQRARFMSNGARSTVTLDQDVMLSSLDLGSAGDFTINSLNDSYVMRMNTGLAGPGGPDSIQARNVGGDSTQTINAPVIFANELQVITDGTYQGPGETKPAANILFNQSLTGQGSAGFRKAGRGRAALNAANSYIGGTVVGGGRLDANVADSLGSGDVFVTNGLLGYNAIHAVRAGATVLADDGGQIDLGISPAADERFNVGTYGIISGNTSELQALSVSTGGNLTLNAGAMIAHESFDAGLAEGNPRGLSATNTQYIFGIANDFDSNVGPQRIITVGTQSGTPWKGFGSDRVDRFFGTDPRSDHEQILVAGDAELRSLDETLVINGQVTSITGGSSLTKTGAGAVALNSEDNNFRAPITVHEGKLLVNGYVYGVTQLTVDEGATLGGRGQIDGPINVKDNARLAPGDNTISGHVGSLITGGLELSSNSLLDFELNDPGVEGAGVNDFLTVNGDLTLDGVLNVIDDGNFGPGAYRLIEFSGLLTDNGLDLGYVPDDGLLYQLNIVSIPRFSSAISGGAVELVVSVPEPASLSLLGTGAVLAMLRPRRRR